VIVLDTDHVTLVEQHDSELGRALRDRLRLSDDRDIRVTAISLEEQMRGWLAAIRRQRAAHRQVIYYDRLIEVAGFFAKWRVLRFDAAAADTYDNLRGQKIRVGSHDLKIAAICLVNDATLLSSNLVDFQQVPGLRVEDWVHS
jgi:tRNA(fMet)-specific endonuclease VapC